MIFISHRGNLTGKHPQENHPDRINYCLSQEVEVEIDVWFVENVFYLGHDKPQYKTDKIFLNNNHLWIHCKNVETLNQFRFNTNTNYFWHENDTVALTSQRFIWAYPGKQPIRKSIAVMPELYLDDITQCIGICSDYIQNYKK